MRRTTPMKLVRALSAPRIPTTPAHPMLDKESAERIERKRQDARRTRLHFFGLAGGRRSR